ncbi:hypothetical protein DDB_G0293458 [Dictyostelium discoideum AX4]|uniref:Uncharacterized protein n=1 Tax=Dictyostelium discoideum TaxID=44689 RepID=Q54BS3_DICDI|nr:hypothetical protein DDB_G0293458 [Dictyostelium discoideum AX4]EAL60713.1 hypothetical protein DDB_G0293458 [Dictyostelium discoideum AX4]|eukprot:XP_629128.1 hypothetical protein DDB_G0293458 [Dictyostelium discoideum AX4]
MAITKTIPQLSKSQPKLFSSTLQSSKPVSPKINVNATLSSPTTSSSIPRPLTKSTTTTSPLTTTTATTGNLFSSIQPMAQSIIHTYT